MYVSKILLLYFNKNFINSKNIIYVHTYTYESIETKLINE